MLFATIGQGTLFAAMMLCGTAVGAWYAVLRLVRRLLAAGPALSLICDLAFGAGAFTLVAGFLLRFAHGEVRLYSLLGVFAGFFLFLCAEKGLRHAFSPVFRPIGKIVRTMSKYRLFKVIFR